MYLAYAVQVVIFVYRLSALIFLQKKTRAKGWGDDIQLSTSKHVLMNARSTKNGRLPPCLQ